MPKIRKIHAREVLDSRGYPTIEVEVSIDKLGDKLSDEMVKKPSKTVTGRAIVPSGASTGEGEALELRDVDPRRYQGKGVLKAVGNVLDLIAPALTGHDFSEQSQLDAALCNLDGSPNKSKLGANAILGVSMAFCRAQALTREIPTDQHLARIFGSPNGTPGHTLPVPLMNILNGGKHADNGLAIQEFMIVPVGFERFSDALRAGVEIFHRLKGILHDQGLSTGVGDEGGFAPTFIGKKPHEQAIHCILQAMTEAQYEPGKNVFLALDAAASEFAVKPTTHPQTSDDCAKYTFEGETLTSEEMISIYRRWTHEFPILSIEDGLSEHDWEGWQSLTQALGKQCQLVGDDLFVTNPILLKKGLEKKAGNSILIKLNQIGTVTETLETMQLAAQSGYSAIVSHRSGETEDTFIADLAVATDCGQIKTGSGSRTDRIAKYNQLLRLEERLGAQGQFAQWKNYEKFRKNQ
jgi:enolase